MATTREAAESAQTRMKSFLGAAKLIASGSGVEGADFARIEESFSSERALAELEASIAKNGIKEALKEHMKEFNDALVAAMSQKIPGLKGKKPEKIFKELMDAENHLNMKTRSPIVSVEDKDGKLVGRSTPEGGFQVLVGGEWTDVENKQQMLDMIGVKEGSPIFVREENPITKFTQAQTNEWLSILDDTDRPKELRVLGMEKPKWFTDLPKWEQKYLQDQIKSWDGETPPNLGDYLGSIPSTIRKYPGAPNAYVTSMDVLKAGPDGEVESKRIFEKVRSGAVVAFDLKGEDRRRITEQNLEQLMANTIQRKLHEAFARGDTSVSIPMAIQTLFSPPFQPAGGDDALAKAVKSIKTRIGEDQEGFLREIGVKIPAGIETVALDTDYSNIPVNKARGLARLASGRSSSSAKMLTDHVSSDKALAQDVAKTLQGGRWNQEDLLESFTAPKHNFNSERAALEQILNFAQGGNRIGSCVSGKDREEMVTEMALAMVMFREINDHLPPPPGLGKKDFASKDEYTKYQGEREQFEGLVARQFLANHGQQIAAANSVGSDGLKNVDEVYGKAICSQIRKKAGEDAFKKSGGELLGPLDPLKETKARAGLNKPEVTKSLGGRIKNFFQKKVLPVVGVIIAIAALPVTLIAAGVIAGVNAYKKSQADKEISGVTPDKVGSTGVVADLQADSPDKPKSRSSAPDVRARIGTLSYGEENERDFIASAPSSIAGGLAKTVSTPEPESPDFATIRATSSAPDVKQEQEVRVSASAPSSTRLR